MKFSDLSHPFLSTQFVYEPQWFENYHHACQSGVKTYRCKYWCFQLAQVLSYLHSNDFFHNDIQPVNLGLVYRPHQVQRNLLWQTKGLNSFTWTENFDIQLRNCDKISCDPADAPIDFKAFILVCLYGSYPYRHPSFSDLVDSFCTNPIVTIRKAPLDRYYRDCLTTTLQCHDWDKVLRHPAWNDFL